MPDERRHIIVIGGAGGLAVEDGVGVHFLGTEIYRAVTAREKACAYQVRVRAGAVEEEVLPIDRDRLQEEDTMVISR